jgi:hypothetical protein
MAIGYSRSPILIKGAIIQFSAPLFVPIPNIIIFQYNPESLSRTLDIWKPPDDGKAKGDPEREALLSQPQNPEESFNIVLELDATDDLENPLAHPQTVITGVADRIAALEMLTYPAKGDSFGSLLGGSLTTLEAIPGGTSVSPDPSTALPPKRKTVPLVLFFFGPGRIVPVRITTFTVDEQAFSPTLYPIRAKVTVGMKVLDPAGLRDDNTFVYQLAKACYNATLGQKETLALIRNGENAIDAITPLLPF